jgi:hypothetical protein
MKTYVLAAMAVVLMSGSAMAYPVRPNAFNKSFRAPVLTPYERVLIQRSQNLLSQLQRRVRADGHVTIWERWRVRMAQNRHQALVYRLTHN